MGISYVGGSPGNDGISSGTDTVTFAKPSGVAAGQCVLAALTTSSTGLTLSASPSGWGQASGSPVTQGSALMLFLFVRVLTTADLLLSSWSFQLSSSNRPTGVLDVFGGVDTTTPVEAVTFDTNGSSTSQAAPAVTSLSNLAWIVNYWGVRAGSGGPFTITPPGTHTTRQGAATAFAAGAVNTAIKSATLTTPGAAGAYGPYTAGVAGSANAGMASVALKPAAAAAATGGFFLFMG